MYCKATLLPFTENFIRRLTCDVTYTISEIISDFCFNSLIPKNIPSYFTLMEELYLNENLVEFDIQ